MLLHPAVLLICAIVFGYVGPNVGLQHDAVTGTVMWTVAGLLLVAGFASRSVLTKR